MEQGDFPKDSIRFPEGSALFWQGQGYANAEPWSPTTCPTNKVLLEEVTWCSKERHGLTTAYYHMRWLNITQLFLSPLAGAHIRKAAWANVPKTRPKMAGQPHIYMGTWMYMGSFKKVGCHWAPQNYGNLNREVMMAHDFLEPKRFWGLYTLFAGKCTSWETLDVR